MQSRMQASQLKNSILVTCWSPQGSSVPFTNIATKGHDYEDAGGVVPYEIYC